MDYTNLYQILAQTNDENEASSPYAPFNSAMGQIGNAAIQYGAKEGDYKTGIIGALLSGILGGAGQSLSNSWVADKNEQTLNLLDQAISGKTLTRPDGMSPSVFSKATTGGNLFRKQNELQTDLAIKQQAAQAIAQNPEAADSVIAALSKLKNLDNGVQPAQGLVREEAPAVPTEQVTKDPLGLGKPYKQKILEDFDTLRRKGAPGGAAMDLAKKFNEADTIDIRNTEENLKKLRERTSFLDTMVATAEAGVAGAGNTGGPGIVNYGRDAASKVLATLGVDDQVKKQTAQANLDSEAANILMAAKPGGFGPMSDRDVTLLLKTGPSSAQTPEANSLLINKLKAISSMNKEYGNFVEYVKEEYGLGAGKADKLWQDYKAANPLYYQREDGEYVPSTQRPSVLSWLESSKSGTPTQQIQQIQEQAPSQDAATQAREILRKRGIAGY